MAYEILNPQWGPRRPIRGVLFDMDGLVLDTEKLYARFWKEACRFYGYPMTQEQAMQMRSANHTLGAENLHRFFGPDVDYEQCRQKRIELMNAYIAANGVEAKAGIVPLLDYLDSVQIPAAITSSSPADRIRQHWDCSIGFAESAPPTMFPQESPPRTFIFMVPPLWGWPRRNVWRWRMHPQALPRHTGQAAFAP